MKDPREKSRWKQVVLISLLALFYSPIALYAIELDSVRMDGGISKKKTIHKIGIGGRVESIVPTNPFLSGENRKGQPIKISTSAHLRYAFQPATDTPLAEIYGYFYQGIGMASYKFGNPEEIGDPFAIYLFQGGRIARLNRKLSLNYDWNFGVSYGWKPYDRLENDLNAMMGSKINAYLNMNFLLEWTLSRHIDLQAGFTITHFSNGNTSLPNSGMNSMGLRVGLVGNFGRDKESSIIQSKRDRFTPKFNRHISYDLMVFGSWCRNVAYINETLIPSPHKYTVIGFNFSPMYNLNQKLRLGISVDGVYNGSANIYTKDYIVGTASGYTFYSPDIKEQLSLGLSARGEFVMPYFSVGVGFGVNTLNKSRDSEITYQIVALKIAVTRSSFVHIGYCLKNFKTPNYLMLGVGYRFNNKKEY